MAADLLIEFLRTTAPRAFCLRCLGEAFAWEPRVQGRIDQAVAHGEPIKVAEDRCTVCSNHTAVFRYSR
jgi:hypothetical protein